MECVADVAGDVLDPFGDEASNDSEVAGHEGVGGVHFVHHVDYISEVGSGLDAELGGCWVGAGDVDDVYDGRAYPAVD